MPYFILCHILSKFEKANKSESPEALALNENYQYARELLKTKFPDQWQKFRTYVESSSVEMELEKVVTCPECGGIEHIVSNGLLRWKCMTCGREFVKNPRRKKQA